MQSVCGSKVLEDMRMGMSLPTVARAESGKQEHIGKVTEFLLADPPL